MGQMTVVPESKRTTLMIHHSASPRKSTTVDMIREWHLQNGWLDIGYTWLIDKDGVRVEGRDPKYAGAHCPRFNTCAWGICVVGNFMVEQPLDEQISQLVYLIKDIYKYHKPGLKIIGHRDGKATECPGDNLYDLLPAIRIKVGLVK